MYTLTFLTSKKFNDIYPSTGPQDVAVVIYFPPITGGDAGGGGPLDKQAIKMIRKMRNKITPPVNKNQSNFNSSININPAIK